MVKKLCTSAHSSYSHFFLFFLPESAQVFSTMVLDFVNIKMLAKTEQNLVCKLMVM